MIQAVLTSQVISLDQLFQDSSLPHQGAQVIFTGTVRSPNLGKTVLGVSYDAFKPLTEVVFNQICKEAQEKWGLDLLIRLIHRVGRLNVGELSVVILVASRHRDEAYCASRYIIEELKHRAPIWKQEHYLDGDSEWLQGHALCGHPELENGQRG